MYAYTSVGSGMKKGAVLLLNMTYPVTPTASYISTVIEKWVEEIMSIGVVGLTTVSRLSRIIVTLNM